MLQIHLLKFECPLTIYIEYLSPPINGCFGFGSDPGFGSTGSDSDLFKIIGSKSFTDFSYTLNVS